MSESEGSPKGEVLVTGATGLVGGALVDTLEARYAGIRTLSRRSRPNRGKRRSFVWDGIDPGVDAVRGVEAVVHLAGEPIFGGLPTAARRERIERSRIESTRALVDRMGALDESERPNVLVCASAVGYYGDRGEERLDESASAGSGFLADVCADWEAEARRAEALQVRVVSIRIGVVLSKDGGALSLMKVPFSLGVGGRLGDGQQFFPWIHLDDLVDVIVWALDSTAAGPVNAVAPDEIRNRELTRALGRALRRPTLFPVPGFVLRLALGELAGELVGSRRVRPSKLIEAGFVFEHATIESALAAEFG